MINKYDQIFNEKLGELLKELAYPFVHSSQFLQEATAKALSFHTCESLQVSEDEYEVVAKWAVGINSTISFMPEMHTALQAVKTITPHQFGITPLKYIEHKRVFNEMQTIWDATAAPYIKQATEYTQSIAKRDEQELVAKQKIKGLNGKSIAFPS